MKEHIHADVVRRAALPEVMFASDLGLALFLPPETAEAAAASGLFGRHFLVRGQVAVLRDDFLAALRTRASIRGSVMKELLSPTLDDGEEGLQ